MVRRIGATCNDLDEGRNFGQDQAWVEALKNECR
jgi:hypothetical protein